MSIPLVQIVEIFFKSVFIWFLYLSAGRRIITRNCKPHPRPVRERYRFLDQSFAERTAANDCSTVVILKRPCQYFARRCCPFINEYNKFSRLKFAFPGCFCITARRGSAFCINNQLAFLQELVSHLNSCFHNTS